MFFPVKINEVRFETGINPTDQFIELYNAGNSDIDLSNWTLINTRSMWAPVKLGTIPAGTKLTAHGFYLLGLSGSGLAAPASRGEKIINVRSTNGFEAGQKINIDGETHTIANVGTAAASNDHDIRPCLHRTMAYNPCRLNQPARHKRSRL